MNKRNTGIISVISLALAAGIGVTAIDRPITPSAEDAEIQSIQMTVDAVVSDVPMDISVYDINSATGDMIDDGITEQHNYNLQAGEPDTVVASRDWTVYDNEYGLERMTDAERQYYRRIEEMAVQYISDNTLDAYYVSSYGMYATNGIIYNDLGLSRSEAIDVVKYFIYNNPQYYFLRAHLLSSSKAVYIECYEAFVNGVDRAAATNNVFDVIDQWIVSINDDEITAYDKLLSAHDLLCNELEYVKGDFDQSVYSAAAQRKTVCAGYAEALTMMLNASGVNTTTVVSDVHAWNSVQLDDGIYYGVDPTWDDILGSHNLFAVGEQGLTKYDKDVEHIAVAPWTEWAPDMSDTAYVLPSAPVDISLAQPSNIEAHYGGAAVRLTWGSVDKADSYDVQITGSSKITSVSYNAVRLTNIPLDKDIVVRIRAKVDTDNGTVYSDWTEYVVRIPSDVVTITTVPAQTVIQTETVVTTQTEPATTTQVKPAVTTAGQTTVPKVAATETTTVVKPVSLSKPNITISGITSNSAKVAWSSVSNASGYEYVFAYDSAYSNVIASRMTTSRGLNLSKLASGRTYYVRVRAYNTSNGNTVYSGWSSASVTAKSDQPFAPESYSAVRRLSNRIRVSWSKADNANKYEVRIYKDAELKNCVAKKTTICNFATLSAGTDKTVYVALRSMNTKTSSYSDWVVFSVR